MLPIDVPHKGVPNTHLNVNPAYFNLTDCRLPNYKATFQKPIAKLTEAICDCRDWIQTAREAVMVVRSGVRDYKNDTTRNTVELASKLINVKTSRFVAGKMGEL